MRILSRIAPAPAVLIVALSAAVCLPTVSAEEPAIVFERSDARPADRRPEPLQADFRHAPPWWQVAICLPDDWQKTLVSKEGALLYDYPGEFSGFATRVSFGVAGAGDANRSQRLLDARTPIVTTTLEAEGPREGGEGVLATATCLAVVPGPDQDLPGCEPGKIVRVEVEATTAATDLPGWGRPGVPCAEAFRNIVAGFGCNVGYRFQAPKEGRYTLAAGFMESHHSEAGQRIVEVFVEGKQRKRLDLIGDLGQHKPGVIALDARDEDGDGYVSLEVRPAPESADQNPILNALWVFPEGQVPAPESLVRGDSGARPLAEVDCGGAGSRTLGPPGPPRGDLMLLRREAGAGALRVAIDSKDSLVPGEAGRGLYRGGMRFLTTSVPWRSARRDGKGVVLEFSGDVRELAVLCASGYDAGDVDLSWAKAQLARSVDFWLKADFPYAAIRVPDRTIQDLLDSSVRNIYQARERREGLPVFQVGPTCYRGLWVVDGAFILEAMTYLGRVDEVRAGIEYLLSRAKSDGSFELIRNYWKENGIVLYILYRHAALTQDWAWLAERWHLLQTLVGVIQNLRARSLENPDAPEAGLLPPGFPDGGVGGRVPEYTNVYWSLAGLKAAVRAARLAGRDTLETTAWEAEYQSLLAAFRRAAARDAKRADDGSVYLPILMREDPQVDPVRGQWAFCHAVFPGEVFDREDPLVAGNMALLGRNESEGLVFGTGWMPDGIWNYFASFYGHAHLWLGNGSKAAEILYAFANHAAPLLVWREEQHPSGKGTGLVGDMPHNWASAEFIRLVRNLLVLERGTELHLLEGLPPEWVRPGETVSLKGVLTNFGPLSMKLEVAPDGSEARFRVSLPRRAPPSRVVVHLGSWASAEEPLVKARAPDGEVEARIALAR